MLTSPSLAGRTVLITGVSRRSGIGFAIARHLLDRGASVFAHSYLAHDAAQTRGAEPGGVDGLLADLRAHGSVEHLDQNLADTGAPEAALEAARAAFGHVDILVANHARSGSGRLDELTAEDLDAFLHENVRATLMLVKAFAAQHDGRAGGRVILFTSGQHRGPMTSEIGYAVSKGAIHQATATLSAELIPHGITVNAVNPGPTDTGWEIGDPTTGLMPLGRWGTPDDAARLVAWLCSDDGGWITGQVIDSEGGFTR